MTKREDWEPEAKALGEDGAGGNSGPDRFTSDPRETSGEKNGGLPDRYSGFPPVVLADAAGIPRMAPFLLSDSDLIDLFRLHRTRFPAATLARYRRMGGLPRVRVGRSKYTRLDDALRFLDAQQGRDL